MTYKKSFSEKAQKYIRENPTLKINVLDCKLNNLGLVNEIKKIQDISDQVICEFFPIEVFGILDQRQIEFIINKGINIRKNVAKESKIAFVVNKSFKVFEMDMIIDQFNKRNVYFLYSLEDISIEDLNKFKKIVIFDIEDKFNIIDKVFRNITSKIDVYGNLTFDYINYLSHFDNITLKSLENESLRKSFQKIKYIIEDFENTDTHDDNEDLLITEYSKIYSDSINTKNIVSPILLFNRSNKAKHMNHFGSVCIKEIFSSFNFIQRTNEIFFILGTDNGIFSICNFNERDHKLETRNIILYCYLQVFLKVTNKNSKDIIISEDIINQILCYYKQEDYNTIETKFHDIINNENNVNYFNQNYISKYYRFFFPYLVNSNSDEILFFIKIIRFLSEEKSNNNKNRIDKLLNQKLSNLNENFNTFLNYETLLILLEFDKAFFLKNVNNFKDTALGFDICLHLSFDGNNEFALHHVRDSLESLNKNLPSNHIYLFSIIKFYMENFLNVKINWGSNVTKDEISTFIQKIFNRDFPFKHIKLSSFHLAIASYFLKTNEMIEEDKIFQQQIKFHNCNSNSFTTYINILN